MAGAKPFDPCDVPTQAAIAKAFNVSPMTISRVVNNQTWVEV